MACVYILLCLKNNTYYIGSAKNKENRIEEHLQGKSKYTRHIRPIKVVFIQEFSTLKEARTVEYRLKRYKSRVIIDKIIKDGYIKSRR